MSIGEAVTDDNEMVEVNGQVEKGIAESESCQI
jgi:hypothetical protein